MNDISPRGIASFITTFRTSDIDQILTLPTPGDNSYTVDWGDGTVDTVTGILPEHTYALAGDYDVTIDGICPIWDFSYLGDNNSQLIDIKQWGHIGLNTAHNMLYNCYGLYNITAIDSFGLGISDFSYMFHGCDNLETVPVANWDLSSATTLEGMFYLCGDLEYLLADTWNVSNCTNFSYMFNECYYLGRYALETDPPPLVINNWDVSKATTFSNMFSWCYYIEVLDLSSWVVSNATDFSYMFNSCDDIVNQPLENWDTSKATNMSYMFSQCYDLSSLDFLYNWDVSKVTDFSYMFFESYIGYDSDGNISVNLSNWDVSSAVNVAYMFYEIYYPEYINLSGWDLSNVTNFDYMLANNSYTEKWDLSYWILPTDTYFGTVFVNLNAEYLDLSTWDVSNVTTFKDMFEYLYYVEHLNLSNWDVTGVTDLSYMFYYLNATSIELANWDVSNCTNFSHMFENCYSLEHLEIATWNVSNGIDFSYMFSYTGLSALDIKNWQLRSGQDFNHMFATSSELLTLDLSNWQMPEALDFSYMFHYCSNIEIFDIANWNPTKVVDLSYMFEGCRYLEIVNLSNWNLLAAEDFSYMFNHLDDYLYTVNITNWHTPSAKNFSHMFFDCYYLTDIDLSYLETINVTDFSYMFYNCRHLTDVDLSTWVVTSGLDFTAMFQNCVYLSNLNLKNWNPVNALTFTHMFDLCSSLPYVDVDTWIVENCTDFSYMFQDCSSLLELYLENWNPVSALTFAYMFNYCLNLAIISVSSWKTPLVTDFSYMFHRTAITYMPLEEWDTSSAIDFSHMFTRTRLLEFNAPDWNTSNVITLNGLFLSCTNIVNIDLQNWDTSSVRDFENSFNTWGYSQALKYVNLRNWTITSTDYYDIRNMFTNHYEYFQFRPSGNFLISVDVTNWDVSNAKSLKYLFCGSERLIDLDVSNWDVSNCEDFSYLFHGCFTIPTLDVSTWNVSSAIDTSELFGKCYVVQTLDVLNWDTSSLVKATGMFHACYLVSELVVTNWDVSKVENMSRMFYACRSITEFILPDWNTSSLENCSMMFIDGAALTELNLQNWVFTPALPNLAGMFAYCPALYTVNVSNWDISNVTSFDKTASFYDLKFYYSGYGYRSVFSRSNLIELDLLSWDVSNLTDINYLFEICKELHTIHVSNWDTLTSTSFAGTFYYCLSFVEIPDITYWDVSNGVDFSYMFYSCTALYSLDIHNWNVATGHTFDSMFRSTTALRDLVITNWTPVQGVIFDSMFESTGLDFLEVPDWDLPIAASFRYTFYATKFTSLNLSNWNILNAIDFYWMFAGCSYLHTVYVRNWSLANAVTFSGMFLSCSSLVNLDVSIWNVSNVQSFSSMFGECNSLVNLDVANWNLAQARTLSKMFLDCHSLSFLDVSNWVFPYMEKMISTFESCTSLTILDVSNWDVSMVSELNYIFKNCSSLTSIDVSYWQFRETFHLGTDYTFKISGMFYGCSKLETIDTTDWNLRTTERLSYVFYGCLRLTSIIGIEDWDVTNVIYFQNMFMGCQDIRTINIGVWDVTRGEFFSSMFQDCTELRSVSLTNWDTTIRGAHYYDPRYFTPFRYMFKNCINLNCFTNINTVDLHNSGDTLGMFDNVPSMVQPDLTNRSNIIIGYDWVNEVFCPIDPSLVFRLLFRTNSPSELVTLPTRNGEISENNNRLSYRMDWGDGTLEYVDTDYPSHVYDVAGDYIIQIEGNCPIWNFEEYPQAKDKVIEVQQWGNVYLDSAEGMFKDCTNLTVTAIDALRSKVVSHKNLFSGCTSLIEIPGPYDETWEDHFSLRGYTNIQDQIDDRNLYYTIYRDIWVTEYSENFSGMFHNCISLIRVDVSNWETDLSIDFSYMFHNCNFLFYLDTSNWVVSSSADFTSMFYNCNELTNIDTSTWDTALSVGFSYMFYKCYNLPYIEVSSWHVSNSISFKSMFEDCTKLRGFYPQNWVVNNSTSFENMFANCILLRDKDFVDLTYWNVWSASNLNRMFYGVQFVKQLDLFNWDVSQMDSFNSMFEGCLDLEALYITNWNTANATSFERMFYNCNNLLCLSHIDTTNQINTDDMFFGTYELLPPDEIEQAEIVAGTNWVNPGVCPLTPFELLFKTTIDGEYITLPTNGINDYSVDWGDGVIEPITTINPSHTYALADTYNVVITGICSKWNFFEVNGSKDNLIGVESWGYIGLESASNMFRDCINLIDIPRDYFYKDITDFSMMFQGCTAIEIIPSIMWDTTAGLNFSAMFKDCSSLICLGSINTVNQITTAEMFLGTASLRNPTVEWQLEILQGYDWINRKTCAPLYFTPVFRIESDSDSITLPTNGVNNYYVDWGDGIVEEIRSTNPTHIYELAGDYIVSIEGLCSAWSFFDVPFSKDNLIRVETWGYIGLYSAQNMFNGCINLESLPVDDYFYRDVTNYSSMFEGCIKLPYLQTKAWDTSKVTDFSYMLKDCSLLTCIDALNTTLQLDTTDMFLGTDLLGHPSLAEQQDIETGIAWVNSEDCPFLHFVTVFKTTVDNESIVLPTNGTNKYTVDWGDGTIEDIIIVNPEHTYATAGDHKISIIGDCPKWNFYEVPDSKDKIIELRRWGKINFTSAANMFRGCTNITVTSANYFPKTITTVASMFQDCTSLANLPSELWDTSNVTIFSDMFSGCTSLTCIGALDTTTQTDTFGMFNGTDLLVQPNAEDKLLLLEGYDWHNDEPCPLLQFVTIFRTTIDNESITLPTNGINDYTVNWGDDVSEDILTINPIHTYSSPGDHVISIKGSCPKWNFFEVPDSKDNIIELKRWGYTGLESVNNMFRDCINLQYIAREYDYINITDFSSMLQGCISLVTIPSKYWDMSNVTLFSNMLNGCIELTCIEALDTTSQTDTTDMFLNTDKLLNPSLADREAILLGSDWENSKSCCILQDYIDNSANWFKENIILEDIANEFHIRVITSGLNNINIMLEGLEDGKVYRFYVEAFANSTNITLNAARVQLASDEVAQINSYVTEDNAWQEIYREFTAIGTTQDIYMQCASSTEWGDTNDISKFRNTIVKEPYEEILADAPNLITNGIFNVDTLGWTTFGSTIDANNQELNITRVSDWPSAVQELILETGNKYKLVLYKTSTNSNDYVAVAAANNNNTGITLFGPYNDNNVGLDLGRHEFTFIADTNRFLWLGNSTAAGDFGIRKFDDISLKEISTLWKQVCGSSGVPPTFTGIIPNFEIIIAE